MNPIDVLWDFLWDVLGYFWSFNINVRRKVWNHVLVDTERNLLESNWWSVWRNVWENVSENVKINVKRNVLRNLERNIEQNVRNNILSNAVRNVDSNSFTSKQLSDAFSMVSDI